MVKVKQVRMIAGRRYAFNGWLPTKVAVERYRKHRVGAKADLKAYKGRSSTGKMGYLIYVFTP